MTAPNPTPKPSVPLPTAPASRYAGHGAGLPVLMAVCISILLSVSPALAETETRTTRDLLTFIRALEAPRGYNDYERRIPSAPPKPLTALTLGEVLDWQVRVRRAGAPSSAAGGYQIIHPTLKRLVHKYGISRSTRFDATTQDRLARLLIGECGPKGPRRTHPRYGNCLAGIWAALPRTQGPRKGRSAHHGVAGNRALTTPDTVLALLAGEHVALGPRPVNPGPVNPGPVDSGPVNPDGGGTRIFAGQPLAFGAGRITVETQDTALPGLGEINAALKDARRNGTLTPALRPSPAVRTWKRDPYAQD